MLHIQEKSGIALPKILKELRQLLKEPLLAPLAPPKPCTPPTLPASKKSTPNYTAALPVTSKAPKDGIVASKAPAQGVAARSYKKPTEPSSSVLSSRPGSSSAVSRSSSLTGLRQGSAAQGTPSSSSSMSAGKSSNSKERSSSLAASSKSQLAAAGNLTLGSKTGSPVGSAASACRAVGFFVYGTLRPDDDSGAGWTKKFQSGLEPVAATLTGASLYIDGCYPAVNFEQTKCTVRGVMLRPSGHSKEARALLATKLTEADEIEGFPDLYDRTVATVHTAEGEAVRAYVYHRTGRTDRANSVRIPDGDWLSRKR